MAADGSVAANRADFYRRIGAIEMAPLWEVLHKLVAKAPVTRAVSHVWRYDEVRPFILESGGIISAAEAERRVLILENPALRGTSQAVDTLYAGLQLILPGEIAPSHRHTPSALRFIVEGDGAYTSVNGERVTMATGDFVITPSWTWHDHGNDSNQPMVWLDGIDIPIVHFTATSFAEPYPEPQFPANTPAGYTRARYGTNMRPVGDSYSAPTSPIFSYPYEESREALETMRRTQYLDPCLAIKMEYINPLTGGPAMPTMSTFLQLLPRGFRTAPYRSTEHTVYSVVEGSGRLVAGEDSDARSLPWGPRDHFAVPGWVQHRLEADDDAVLFSFSDRTMQQKLGLWREWRGSA